MIEETKPESRSGSQVGYKVEARVMSKFAPKQLGEQIFDNQWRTINFSESAYGIKTAGRFDFGLLQFSLMRYEAANALRWWFLSELGSLSSLETRLVPYRVEYTCKSHKQEPIEELPEQGTKP